MSNNKPPAQPQGRFVRLDEGRVIFLGHDAHYPDMGFIGFRNREGEDTKLTLSNEAIAALRHLLNGGTAEIGPFPENPEAAVQQEKLRWQIIGDIQKLIAQFDGPELE